MTSMRKGFSAFFPTPRYLLFSGAGLVITDDEVRMIEFAPGPRETLKFARFERVSLPENTIQAGFVNDQEALKAALVNIAYKGVRYVHVTLPEERTYLFTATIDKVPEESLPDAVAFILEENVPLPLANAVFDYVVVGEPMPGKIKVAVSVLSRKAVDFYVELLRTAGLESVSFNLESQATARAIVPEGEKGTVLIIKLARKKVGLYVVADGVVQFSSTLPYGASLRPTDLKAEILKVVAFWNVRAKEDGSAPIISALFCGAVPLEPALAQEILHESGLSISSADPWVNAPIKATEIPEEVAAHPLSFTATIGTGLGTSGDHLFRLLSEESKHRLVREYDSRRWVVALGALSLALLVGLVGLVPAYVLVRVQAEEALGKGAAISEAKSAESAALSKWLADERSKLAALTPKVDKLPPSTLVKKLISVKPAGISITSLNWSGESGGVLTVTGSAANRQSLLSLEDALNASGDYTDVSLPLSSLAKEKDIPFDVKLTPKLTP